MLAAEIIRITPEAKDAFWHTLFQFWPWLALAFLLGILKIRAERWIDERKKVRRRKQDGKF
jgi:hypothetical protein